MQEHKQIIAKIENLKNKINTKDFCKFHGISESKFSRFPSDKFVKELQLIDYMEQYFEYHKK